MNFYTGRRILPEPMACLLQKGFYLDFLACFTCQSTCSKTNPNTEPIGNPFMSIHP